MSSSPQLVTEPGFEICPICEKRTSTLYFRQVDGENLCVLCASILEKEHSKKAHASHLRKDDRAQLLKFIGVILAGCALVGLLLFGLYYWMTHRPLKRAPLPPVVAAAIPAPAPKPPLAPAGTSVTISLRSDVLFDVGKSVIEVKAENALSEVATLITQAAGAKAHIIGYTDVKGSKEANLILSLHRANAVKEWLMKKKGISENLISTEGQGEKNPLALETNADGSDNRDARQKNRRVTVTISRPAYAPAPAIPVRATPAVPAVRR